MVNYPYLEIGLQFGETNRIKTKKESLENGYLNQPTQGPFALLFSFLFYVVISGKQKKMKQQKKKIVVTLWNITRHPSKSMQNEICISYFVSLLKSLQLQLMLEWVLNIEYL